MTAIDTLYRSMEGTGRSVNLLIEIGGATLDVQVAEGTDLDDTFTAHCNDTGETLTINGWLIDSSEEI